MMAVTIEKPTPKWRNILHWAAVGAAFYVVAVAGITALRDMDDLAALFEPEAAASRMGLGLGLILIALVVGLSMWNTPLSRRAVSKFMATAGGSAVIGYFGFRMGMQLHDAGSLGAIGPSEIIAVVTGLFCLLLAVTIGAGLASPRFGARFLNVEDAEELRDQRRMLAYAAAGLAAIGMFLALLALAGPGRVISPFVALVGALVLLVAMGVFGFFQWRHMDELARSLSQECGAMTCYLIMAVGGGWVALAHLGFAPGPAPLDWLSMFCWLAFVAAFIGAGRRGLLVPR